MSKLKELGLDWSVERFNRDDKQIADTLGHELTGRGRAVSDQCLPALISYLNAYRPHSSKARLWAILGPVKPDRLAAAILSGAIHRIGRASNDSRDATHQEAMERIGTALERECRSARLLRKNAEGSARLDWDALQLHSAGAWGVDVLLQALPGIFELVSNKGANYFVLSAKAEDIADETLWACVRNNPHHVPMLSPPQPWTSESRDGEWGERQLLVKCRPNSLRMDAVRKALALESKPWLDALHKLESVPYRINEPMLRFVQQSYKMATDEGRHGLGFLFHDNTIRVWRWDREAQKRHRVIIAKAGDRNKGGERTFRTDMMTAEELLNHAFYVPMNFDTRGRVYALPSFNFTRGDHIRCLFEFDEGKPIGDRGLYWLKVHVANTAAGFDKSKPGELTFEQRVEWVDERLDTLSDIGRVALESFEVDEALLSDVVDRFQFVRACIELHRANDNPAFVSHLPLVFDASSNGLQHFCMMTRDQDGGRMVNLVPNLPPQDVYQEVSDRIDKHSIAVGYDEPRPGVHTPKLVDADAQAWAHVFGRKLVKRAVMTRFYGSERFGMTNQLADSRKLFGLTFDQAQRFPVAIIATVDQTLQRPAKAMQFIQDIAKLLAEEHKSLDWITPTGFPWQNRYHEPKEKTLKSRAGDRTVQTTITIGDLPELRLEKTENSSAPNLVQGLEAAHLQLVALWARDAKIPLVSVNDCFGSLAADAEQFRLKVHDRLAQMYLDHPDVLGEILESARRDLSPVGRAKLPALPECGTLNVEEVRYAKYITG